jgi:endonuclease YncB( thermonuclease family)
MKDRLRTDKGRRRQVAFLLFAAATTTAGACHGEAAAPCRLERLGTANVRSAIDGRTLLLADGREVRLAAIEIPETAGTAARAGGTATEALDRLASGREVVLKALGPSSDRYGRVLAHVFVAENGAERWVQSDLVGLGMALVAARVGEKACAGALLAREQAARGANLGVWADPYYVIRHAEEPGAVLSGLGRFAIVEGKVVSVRESGGTIYVNFGRRWSEDFTVTIAKRNERMFAEAGVDPKRFAGRRVRVRGVIEERGGPWVEAVRPEQFELAEK